MPGKILVWTSPKHHTLWGYHRQQNTFQGNAINFPLKGQKIDLKISITGHKIAIYGLKISIFDLKISISGLKILILASKYQYLASKY